MNRQLHRCPYTDEGLTQALAIQGETMSQVTAETQAAIRALLQEVVLGPEAEYGNLLEHGAGFLPTLSEVSAGPAAKPPAPGRPSLAQHVRHVTMSLRYRADWLEGHETQPDWAGVWAVPHPDDATLDDIGWREVKDELKRAHGAFDVALEHHTWPGELEQLLAVSTHVAYHLGIVRQIWLNLNALK
jgi:hypothetical protein